MSNFQLGDYVEVKDRIALFLKEFPLGSLQFEFKGTLDSNPDMIWGIAYAYRTPDDIRPGVGTAAELAIGKTTYTRGSELMNLETSAWGRAIAALGIGLTGKGLATKQEVEAAKARQTTEDDPWGEKPPIELPRTTGFEVMTVKQFAMIKSLFGHDVDAMNEYVQQYKLDNNFPTDTRLSKTGASKLIEQLKAEGRVPTPNPKNKIDPESKWD